MAMLLDRISTLGHCGVLYVGAINRLNMVHMSAVLMVESTLCRCALLKIILTTQVLCY